MRTFVTKSALFVLGLSITLCLCCRPKDQKATETPDKKQVEAKAPADPNVVAKIEDYIITKAELKTTLMRELRPGPYESRSDDKMPTAKTALLKMIAEKAIIIDARSQKLNEDEQVKKTMTQFMEKKLVNFLLQTHLQDKIKVSDSEIDAKMRGDPKLDRERAKAMVMREKANRIFTKYYADLQKKFHVQKITDNFPKAVQIHQKLLFRPQKPRKVGFIRIRQITDELTPEEQNTPLATFDHGKVTIKDWLDALCELSPPSRPRDLNTLQGVDKLLSRALRTPILVAEARLNGLDKDEGLLKEAKEYEDRILLNKTRSEKLRDIRGPIAQEQLLAYFNENKEEFGTQNMLKLNQIWCQDLKTARKAKAELDNGKDFESVRQTYSLEKQANPYTAYPSGDGMFFNDLWKGDPNEVVGPVKGFYSDGIKWRIAKILEKTPGQIKEYSADMKNMIESKILEKQRNEALKKYRTELLEKYPHEIYEERIKNIDPLNIP